jgi:riboflavin kinase
MSNNTFREQNAITQAELPDALFDLPDHTFTNWCFISYGVNKGIYNVLDDLFYQNGIRNILDRRRTILTFLQFITNKRLEKNSKQTLKFGKGGVSQLVQEFIQNTERFKDL